MTWASRRITARANRLGLWTVSLPWRVRARREKLARFGSKYGGWLLPVDRLTPSGVCYCAGVGEDTSLEDDLLRRTDCRVWSFDPTPRAIAHVAKQALNPARFVFVPIGLWDASETMRFFEPRDSTEVSHSLVNLQKTDSYFEAPCTTVAALMRRFDHGALALLKLNIEGGEWRVLSNILEERPDVRVLCVEFCGPTAFWRVAAMVRKLHRAGYEYLCHDRWKFTFAHTDALRAAVPRGEHSHAA